MVTLLAPPPTPCLVFLDVVVVSPKLQCTPELMVQIFSAPLPSPLTSAPSSSVHRALGPCWPHPPSTDPHLRKDLPSHFSELRTGMSFTGVWGLL